MMTLPPLERVREEVSQRIRPRATSAESVIVAGALGVLSAVAAWTLLFVFVLSSLQETRSQHNAYSAFREQLAKATAPVGGTIAPRSPVALLNSAVLGLHDLVVIEGTASGDLQQGPGHVRSSVLPGQAGVAVVYGRSKLFGAPFDRIGRARAGDVITAVTGQGTFTYVVEDVRNAGDPYPLPLSAGDGRLTLVTSTGGTSSSGWLPGHALYVDARLKGQAQPTPPGRPTAVPRAERAMHGDPGSLLMLVLSIPVLIVAVVASVWAFVRWGVWQSWLVGVPVIVAALWFVTETAVQLLPNLV